MTNKLLFPPRFRRGDPRNLERMRISRMIKRYDKIIRRSKQPARRLPAEGEKNGAHGSD